MQSKASTPKAYIAELPEDRKEPIRKFRKVILDNLPDGFEEQMTYGMLGYVVPHSRYPDGYHCDPKQPLPFINLASQKNYIALYHSGIYSDPKLLDWFTNKGQNIWILNWIWGKVASDLKIRQRSRTNSWVN